jgi:hypothetical protein
MPPINRNMEDQRVKEPDDHQGVKSDNGLSAGQTAIFTGRRNISYQGGKSE